MNLRTALSSIALAASCSSPAFAIALNPAAVACGDSFTVFNGGYLDCAGPITGSLGASAVQSVSFAGYGSFALAGVTGDNSGAFTADPGPVEFGTLGLGLGLGVPQRGAFVIGLQGGGSYSLYLFSGSASVDFDTFGVVDALGHPGPDLTRAALFLPSVVPEPESYALLLAGLASLGFLASRRRARAL